VYLCLVSACGASPQVFAHSALTRNFDIQDEVEVKDDLDKKPEPAAEKFDHKSNAELTARVSESVKSFLSQFKRTQPISAFGPTPDFIFSSEHLVDSPALTVINSK